VLVDANLLLFAVDATSPHHARAAAWLEESLSLDPPK
jgi:predicted nucleic acid-binding protein